MKIAWYTPFAANSAIGRFSRLVTKALRARGAEVQIVRSETRTTEVRSAGLIDPNEKCIWAADIRRNLKKQLAAYDIVIYNIGDHYDNHAYCFAHQPVVPGLTILHDYCLHNALHRHCLRSPVTVGNYRDQLAIDCGSEATSVFDNSLKSNEIDKWWNQQVVDFPIYRWALQDTLGVVTHAEFYRNQVAERIGSPTAMIPLAYDSAGSGNQLRLDEPQRFNILTVGTVNTNKRHAAVIRALAASSDLRQQCEYRIVGAADTEQRQAISEACRSYADPPNVTVTGQVSREQLAREFDNADVISCLRHPTFEGASASVIEGLRSGKPVIVSTHGCYAEIPDDIVFKVAPDQEHRELTQVLQDITSDYSTALARAAMAQNWAIKRHAPEAYAGQLLEFIQTVLYNQPVLRLVDRVAGHLQRWDASANGQLIQRLDRAVQDLFSERTKPSKAA